MKPLGTYWIGGKLTIKKKKNDDYGDGDCVYFCPNSICETPWVRDEPAGIFEASRSSWMDARATLLIGYFHRLGRSLSSTRQGHEKGGGGGSYVSGVRFRHEFWTTGPTVRMYIPGASDQLCLEI